MARIKFTHFVPRDKPPKRPRRHKKSLNKSEKRSYKKYNRQGRGWQISQILLYRIIERIIMNQHFIIRYKVEDDIPVCPDHILNELKTHVEIIQSKLDAKNLFGKHTLELRAVKEGWFEEANDNE